MKCLREAKIRTLIWQRQKKIYNDIRRELRTKMDDLPQRNNDLATTKEDIYNDIRRELRTKMDDLPQTLHPNNTMRFKIL